MAHSVTGRLAGGGACREQESMETPQQDLRFDFTRWRGQRGGRWTLNYYERGELSVGSLLCSRLLEWWPAPIPSSQAVFDLIMQAHSNETIGSVRWKIAKQLCSPVDNIQIFTNDSLVSLCQPSGPLA